MTNKKFCPIPWAHLQVEPDGSVRPCCITQANPDSYIGNINNSTLEELWNAPRMQTLRRNIMSGEGDQICDRCYAYDDAGLPSFRHNAVEGMLPRLPGVAKSLASTDENGFAPDVNMEYWDFRFSNICNYKCRSCGPGYSSNWYGDAEKIGWGREVPANRRPITWLKKVEDRIAVLDDYIGNVKEIYFAGGEPLIMDEHFRVLDLLIAAGRTDVRIRYNTNMSSLKYKGKDLIEDYWSHFSEVEVSGSLDVAGAQAEYVRAGTKWETLDANIRRLQQASAEGKIKFFVNVTISNMTVFYLEDLLDYLIDVKVVNDLASYRSRPWQFFFNLVFTPTYYSIQHMPESAKQDLRDRFDAFDQKLKTKYGVNYSMFTELYPILDLPADKEEQYRYIRQTKALDTVRQEDVSVTLPRLWQHYEPLVQYANE
jgi:radical SAM protein with 4Fe4S-binding SPASM domain